MSDLDAASPPEEPERPSSMPYGCIPEGFLGRLSRMLTPDDFAATVRSFVEPKRTSFRINTLVSGAGSALRQLASEGVPFLPAPAPPDVFSVDSLHREALLASTVYRERRIYVQNPASMVPAIVLAPVAGDEVLDLAAAPGSKTHQMACIMGNSGRITAVESVRSRYYKLRDNMEAMGAEIVRPFFQDGTMTWRHRPEYFDRVLLDAPCSSEGRFRSDDPETTRYWSPRKVREMSRKQRRLLFSAIQCLRPGGRLVYSTCSFAPEENEVVVHKLLLKFSDALRVVPPDVALPGFRDGLTAWDGREFSPHLRHARRIVPDDLFDGFFVCCLEKISSTAG